VKAFVAALDRANRQLNENPEEKIQRVAEFTKSDPALVRDLILDGWTIKVNPADIQQQADLMLKHGQLKERFDTEPMIYETAK
jgi:ABC-type nitrate/sulfonate/bicarbonate transport system substrate-binding protein